MKPNVIYVHIPPAQEKTGHLITTDLEKNKTISDGGITVDFSIIKVHTSN